jgi:alpha-ketoglutarate-dependent taurine dioxygenase
LIVHSTTIGIARCQPFIGAEISGVDLKKPISEDVANALRAALLEYQVIVLRDQDITREQHIELANVFVKDRSNPFLIQKVQAHPIPEHPEIFNVKADGVKKTAADIWHTDESFHVCPPTVSLLRGRIVPKLGGDTCFSSGVAAYERLPGDVKSRIRSLKAWHGVQWQDLSLADPKKVEAYLAENKPYAQPVVRVHPETRKPVLFVNDNYTGPFIGLDESEGKVLRRYLVDQFKKPDYQMRLRWQPNTIVIWDNRSVQHYAVYDYNEPRAMERILVRGIEPAIGIDEATG